MDVARFVAVAAEYPPPPAAAGSAAPMRFAYGTAGFRTAGHLLRSTVFRCGALAAVRSAVTGGAAPPGPGFGLCVIRYTSLGHHFTMG